MFSVVFYARFLTHHLTDFCDAMYELTDKNFYFVETEKMPDMRKKLGYKEEGLYRDYCINIRESQENMDFALKLARECSVAIIGCGSYRFMNERLDNSNKLTFKLKERLFKKGVASRYWPEVKVDMYNKHQKFLVKNVYYLSAGVFTATDVNFLGYAPERIIKWGYFPPFREHTAEELRTRKNKDYTDIIWVGRFMQTKHPQSAIKALRYVAKECDNFRLSYIGGGELEEEMRMLVSKYHLEKFVNFEGYLPADKVRDRMLEADICLCTSGYEEGWGATISEAMNEGCMVIGSGAAGGTGYLVKPGVNGMIYAHTNIRALADCIIKALKSPESIIDNGINGYEIIKNTWNGRVAAERFKDISISMLNGENWNVYEEGPCSLAPIVHTVKELVQWRHAYTPKNKISIAIDGYAGCGKSTLAKLLVKKFGLLCIDSGILYRFATHMLLEKGSLEDSDLSFFDDVDITADGSVLYRGNSIEHLLATEDVRAAVAGVSQQSDIRQAVNDWIKRKSDADSIVIVGRDIGAVVLPDADIKLFLYSDIEYRISNWCKGQMEKKGYIDEKLMEMERNNLLMRDYEDTHRKISPLVCADDAISICVDKIGIDKMHTMVCDLIKRRYTGS